MRLFFISLIAMFFFSVSVEAMCTWTYVGCGDYCYYKGTSSCRNHSCKIEMGDHGTVTVSRMGEVVGVGVRDMSNRPEDDCTLVYIFS